MELYYIWIECIKGLGPFGWHALLGEFGNPYEIYKNRMLLLPQGSVTRHHIQLIKTGADEPGNLMMGISYLDSAAGEYVGKMLL